MSTRKNERRTVRCCPECKGTEYSHRNAAEVTVPAEMKNPEDDYKCLECGWTGNELDTRKAKNRGPAGRAGLAKALDEADSFEELGRIQKAGLRTDREHTVSHTPDDLNHPFDSAYRKGALAYRRGSPRDACPYEKPDSGWSFTASCREAWFDGYDTESEHRDIAYTDEGVIEKRCPACRWTAVERLDGKAVCSCCRVEYPPEASRRERDWAICGSYDTNRDVACHRPIAEVDEFCEDHA